MRTRTSWKNQDKLFKELFKPKTIRRSEEARNCFDCANEVGFRCIIRRAGIKCTNKSQWHAKRAASAESQPAIIQQTNKGATLNG